MNQSIYHNSRFKVTYRKRCPSDLATPIKMLTSKQMLPRSSVALAQVNAGNTNTSENLLNEIR